MYRISWKGTLFGSYKDAYAPIRDLKLYGKDAFITNQWGEPV